MKIERFLPNLTIQEARRFWMRPEDVCDLAAIGDEDAPDVRRFLSNVSDKGFVPFKKSGAAKTAPRLYSLESAVVLRAMRELTATGRNYQFAAPIAAKAGEILIDLIGKFENYDEIDEADWLIKYHDDWRGRAKSIEVIRAADFTSQKVVDSFDTGILAAGMLAWNAIHRYGDFWARDRQFRNIDVAGRYDGCDLAGYPLDPAHPWNRDLPPLERAKRLLEIEEYIVARAAADRDQET